MLLEKDTHLCLQLGQVDGQVRRMFLGVQQGIVQFIEYLGRRETRGEKAMNTPKLHLLQYWVLVLLFLLLTPSTSLIRCA